MTTNSSTAKKPRARKPRARKPKASATKKRAAPRAVVAEDNPNAPVSLPSGGSFELDALRTGLGAAADKPAAERGEAISKALDKARGDVGTVGGAPGMIPGHKIVEADVQLGDGVTVTERRQVLDPDSAQAETGGGQAVAGGRSEVVSTSDVEQSDEPAAHTDSATGDQSGATNASGDGGEA